MELFTAAALANISYNIIAAILYDAGRFGLSFASEKELEDIFAQALKDSVKDLKNEPARELRQVFKTHEVQKKIWAFQQHGEIIPTEFFATVFEKVVGKTHARLLAKNLFVHFRQRLAKKETLAREIQFIFLEKFSAQLIAFAKQQYEHDVENRKQHQEILDAIRALEKSFQKQKNIEATIGYQEIPPLPKDFVAPQIALSAVKSQMAQKHVVLVWGAPGAGKSVLVTALAREAAAVQRPVFWFRFQRLLTDLKTVQSNLLPFLQQEIGEPSENLPVLLAKSRALLIFDDLQHAEGDELQRFLATVVSLLAGSGNKNCQMLFTSHERSAFLPVQKIALYRHEGFAPTEAEALMTDKWQLALQPAQQKRALEILDYHPQYLQFFHQWYLLVQPDEERLARYFAHAPNEDENMQDYLMRELYETLGGSESNANKLLVAVAFYRIPERKEFIERLFGELDGEKFGETLHLVQNRRGLLQYLSEAQRYTLHDVLREFYYQKAEAKSRLHACCAAWYQECLRSEADLIDYIEGAHHFRKAGDHQAAATLLRRVTHHCTTHGYYWQPLRDILERFDLKTLSDEELIFATAYDLGNLQFYMGAWEAALRSFSQCLQMPFQQDLYHIVHNSLGMVYKSKGEWDKAIEFFQKSLDGKEKIEDVRGMAVTFNNLGLAYQDKGEWDKAIEFYQKALEISKKDGDVHGMAITYGNLGIVYQLKGEWDKAIEFYQKALAGKEKVGDIHGIAMTFNNLGLAYQAKGEWEKAIEFYQKSFEISEKFGDVHGMAQTYDNLGVAHQTKGEWDKAIDFFDKALAGKEIVGDIHGMASTFNNIGLVYQAKGEKDKAIDFFDKALAGKEKVGDVHGMASTFNNLGLVYQAKGEKDKAFEVYEKALGGLEKVGDIHGMAQTYGNLSFLYFQQKQYLEAIHLLIEILFLFIKLGAAPLVQHVNGNLAYFQKQLGEKAFGHYFNQTLSGILANGITWGRHQVVTKEEAQEIGQKLRRKE